MGADEVDEKCRTDGRIDKAQENDGSDGADVVVGALGESLAQHLVETVAHAAELRRKTIRRRYYGIEDPLRQVDEVVPILVQIFARLQSTSDVKTQNRFIYSGRYRLLEFFYLAGSTS